MDLSKLLTIVIPCKNEDKIIYKTLDLLNYQNGIENVNVVVCDSSDDDITPYKLDKRSRDKFNLNIISGGLPSIARNNGAKHCSTPYVLFMDADIFILDPNVLLKTIKTLMDNDYDLVTSKIRTSNGQFNFVFRAFDFIQTIVKPISPFCMGGFMLVKMEIYDKIGGFDEDAKVAEDYLFSKQIKPSKFKRDDTIVFTTPRRFQSKGLFYMVKLMVLSFLNRENKKYFENHNDYWK